MAGRNFNKTHDKILTSGKEYFLRYGYEHTNLRDMCKDAGITTGAFYRHFKDKHSLFTELVHPIIIGIDKIYDDFSNSFHAFIKDGYIVDFIDHNIKFMDIIIDFIYCNFDIFKLLFIKSNGTKYDNFIDYLAKKEDESVAKTITILKKQGIKINMLNVNEIHMLNHAYFACIAEIVMHDYEKNMAITYCKTISYFFSAGWEKAFFGNN